MNRMRPKPGSPQPFTCVVLLDCDAVGDQAVQFRAAPRRAGYQGSILVLTSEKDASSVSGEQSGKSRRAGPGSAPSPNAGIETSNVCRQRASSRCSKEFSMASLTRQSPTSWAFRKAPPKPYCGRYFGRPLRGRDRHRRFGLPPPSRHQQVKQNRASHVQLDHERLSGETVRESRGHREPDWEYHHQSRISHPDLTRTAVPGHTPGSGRPDGSAHFRYAAEQVGGLLDGNILVQCRMRGARPGSHVI